MAHQQRQEAHVVVPCLLDERTLWHSGVVPGGSGLLLVCESLIVSFRIPWTHLTRGSRHHGETHVPLPRKALDGLGSLDTRDRRATGC